MYTLDSPLLSLGQAPAYVIQSWIQRHNPNAPADFASLLVNQCARAGLNADLCAAQVMHETGWLTSDWFIKHNNPAGVGVTGQPGVGITFPTVEAGIHGYLAHLLTYCEGSGNPWKADDPRYQAAASAGYAGKVKTVGGLGGTWAYPGVGYGDALVKLANDLVASIGGGGTMAADDPQAEWLPSSNFDQGRGGVALDLIVMHTTEGGFDGAVQWLRGAASGSNNRNSSSHYVIRADGGKIAQLVHEADTAWAAGNYPYNQRGIQIEQEGYADKGGFSDGLYQAAGELVGRIAKRHNLTLDRAHVIGHMDVPNQDHHDPGPHYDFDRLIAIAKGGGQASPMTGDPDHIYFPETQHWLSFGFKAFWTKFGGLPIFGFSISEEFEEDGLTVQYFEKGARFELHPDSPGNPPNDWHVMLGNVGAEHLDEMKQKYPEAFAPQPAP